MPVIEEFANEIEVYADIDMADLYLEASFHGAVDWDALGDEVKARALVTATRLLERQSWRGEKAITSPAQVLAWPRTGTGIAGVEDGVVPQPIIDGSIELALSLVQGSEVQNEQNTSQKLASLRAGSVALTYFRGAEGTPTRFPTIVQELLGPYLAGSSSTVTGVATGTDGETITAKDFGLNRGL